MSLSAAVVRRALGISVVEGMLWAVMVGVSESYLGAFSVELGLGSHAIGLLATVPPLAGSIVQLFSEPLAELLGSRKRLVVGGAAVQAVTHAGLFAIAWAGHASFAVLLGTAVIYWASGAVIAPAWGAWMAELIGGRPRERYFAWRAAAVQAALVVSFLGAGAILARMGASRVLQGFCVLFAIALVGRSLSALGLAIQVDPRSSALAAPPLAERVTIAVRESRWATPFLIVMLSFASFMAVPFFTPYMLRELHMPYGDYAPLLAYALAVKVVVFPLCHRWADRLGLQRLLFVSGIGVALSPAVWVFTSDYHALVGAQFFSGIVWAVFEYASYQALLAAAHPDGRLTFLAIAACAQGLAQLGGSFAGSALHEEIGLSYPNVFLASMIARAVALGAWAARGVIKRR